MRWSEQIAYLVSMSIDMGHGAEAGSSVVPLATGVLDVWMHAAKGAATLVECRLGLKFTVVRRGDAFWSLGITGDASHRRPQAPQTRAR